MYYTLNLSLLVVLVGRVLGGCWKDTECSGPSQASFPGIWDKHKYAPASRSVVPVKVLSSPELKPSIYNEQIHLSGNGSKVVFDFGIEVGGLVSLNYSSTGAGQLGLAFTEAKNYIGEWSDSSNGKFAGPDGALYSKFNNSKVNYQMPEQRLRGGFRYMTAFLHSDTTSNASVSISNVKTELNFMPTWNDLGAYQGYFYSSDELLNRIWYAGAYTLQSNCVPPNTGRQVPFLTNGWANNATISNGSTVIVDGAKRDRAVWPGDMGIAIPSMFMSLGDLSSVKNALQVMYDYQNPTTGAFDEAGPPLSQKGSDTYHMWTMIGTYNYVLYTGDTEFVSVNWPKYEHAMRFVLAKIDSSSLLNVTGIRDWARWQQGGHNTEANTILYHTLTTAASLAKWLSKNDLALDWTRQATVLASAINDHSFDNTYGAFRDNDTTTTLHPQDANSLALLFNLTSPERTTSISKQLTNNWTPIGPNSPELPNNISPFITSFELGAHLPAREPERALDLLRRTWGWMLNNENSTQSTLLEGYLVNGTFGYRGNRGYSYDDSYVSHAHGWSTGPTSMLMSGILGLEVTGLKGSEWRLAPQWGDLESVEGGFTTVLGKFKASWEKDENGAKLTWNVPVGTKGVIVLPAEENGRRLKIGGDGVHGQAVRRDSKAGKDVLIFETEGNQGTVQIR